MTPLWRLLEIVHHSIALNDHAVKPLPSLYPRPATPDCSACIAFDIPRRVTGRKNASALRASRRCVTSKMSSTFAMLQKRLNAGKDAATTATHRHSAIPMGEYRSPAAGVAVGVRRQVKPIVDYVVIKARSAIFTYTHLEFAHDRLPIRAKKSIRMPTESPIRDEGRLR